MSLRIVPVAQFAIAALLMFGFAWFFPEFNRSFPNQRTLASIFALASMSLGISAVVSFKKSETTVDPSHPEDASHLVTYGVYRLTRNPMYLALAIMLIAWGFYLGNFYSLIAVLAFILYITKFQIKPEEKVLAAKFGEDYQRYRLRVRRWI